MPETLMRWIFAAILATGSLILIRASMWMNYLSWYGQGGDTATSELLGQVSITFDGFKSILPVVIAWAWSANHRRAASIATIFFCGCLGFSLYGALGLANESWSRMAGHREAAQQRHAAAGRELVDVEKQITALGTARPQAVVEQLIEQGKQDRRWASSGQCSSPANEFQRSFCKEIAALRTELASSIASGQLRSRAKDLESEISKLLGAGVRSKLDGHAEFIARLLRLPVESIQTGRSLLVTLLLEFGAAFGFLMAGLPLVTCKDRNTIEFMPPARGGGKPPPVKPTRFVRKEGRLQIK